MQDGYTFFIRKDSLKFSAAHMTVFADGSKENLHGHNYQVQMEIDVAPLTIKDLVPFKTFKETAQEICNLWDERTLLAHQCPFLEIIDQKYGEVTISLCGKRYLFPSEDVVWLPVDNITCENLAEMYCRLFVDSLDPNVLKAAVRAIRVRIEQSPGLGASFAWQPT